MTIINLAALIALILAMNITKRNGYKFKPSDPRPVVIKGGIDEEENLPDEWKEKVANQPTTVHDLVYYLWFRADCFAGDSRSSENPSTM